MKKVKRNSILAIWLMTFGVSPMVSAEDLLQNRGGGRGGGGARPSPAPRPSPGPGPSRPMPRPAPSPGPRPMPRPSPAPRPTPGPGPSRPMPRPAPSPGPRPMPRPSPAPRPSPGPGPSRPMPGPRPTPGPGPNRPNPGPRPGGHRIPGNRPLPGGGVVHRDPNGNVITRNHPGRINTVNNRINTVMRRDPRIGGVVNRHGGWYRTNRYPYSVTRHNWYYGHYNNWRVRYSPWWRHGFYGGYYWPYRPILDINIYFYNPMIYWFYVPVWDDYYYRVWYERYYDQYPELRTPFPYAGIFFPTEEFKDLNISVSGMDIRSQINYRHAIVSLHDQMRSQFSIILGTQIAFGQNDIVVTHYQFMPNDNGIVVEGFANYQQQSLPFKGYLDLNSGSTWVFTTASDGSSPSPQEMDSLNQLNTRIEAAGGVVEGEALNRNRMNFFDDNRNEIIDENVNE